ncbi:MAG: hypothetical protein FWE17_01030 [Alphaproteobacteria bacterium]|nr:hypothetical protein [Alphaproteobacteria bacterium]MCL2758198.1 hypothetical protein [Alphaproteobacteria bacterium]
MEIAKNYYPRTFGRVHGKKLSARKQWLVDNLLPALSPVQIDAGVEDIRPLDARCSTPANNAILEIGFGAGEHILHLAENSQSLQIIGAEPFINGVASLLSAMAQQSLELRVESLDNIVKSEYKNIRIWPDDIRKLLNPNSQLSTLNSANLCFAKIYILHPDPWPKARHEKRRLLSTEFLNELAGRLTPAGRILVATDHLDYFDWILEQVKKSKLKIQNSNFQIPPEAGLDTRYKKKDMFGANETRYIVLVKK